MQLRQKPSIEEQMYLQQHKKYKKVEKTLENGNIIYENIDVKEGESFNSLDTANISIDNS